MQKIYFQAPQRIWKYNALFHLGTSEHATSSTPPQIPRQLLADMHIRKEEEKAFNIIKKRLQILGGKNILYITQALNGMIQAEEIKKQKKETDFIAMSQKGLEYILCQSNF